MTSRNLEELSECLFEPRRLLWLDSQNPVTSSMRSPSR